MRQDVDPDRVSAARLEVVAELATLINRTFDLGEIFQAAIEKLRRVLPFRRASVVLVTDDRASYRLHTLYDTAQGGFVEAEGRFPLNRGLTGEAIRTGQAIRVDAFEGTEGIRTGGEKTVSALIVPLNVDGEVIGTLNLGARESDSYGPEDLELAVLLGRQIETSLHYSKLLATIADQREALAREHARVRSERSRLEALIEASDAAILMVSEGRVSYANTRMSEIVGLPAEVLIGAEPERLERALRRSFVDPGALDAQSRALQAGAAPLRDRVELRFPKSMVCQRTVRAVRDEDGVTIGHLLIYRDVTREAEAEAAKDEFVSVVSHELRTPLTSVKTSIDLLLKGAAGALGDRVRELLEIALRNLDRLIRLVEDLLDLSRIESGRLVTKLVPVPIDAALERSLEAVRDFAEERGVRVAATAGDDFAVLADPDRLDQVIVNLLSNAVKFSPEGERVEVRSWETSDWGVVEIRDRGPGIPAEQLDRIFDKFRQLESSATRRHGGAGLGLAISRSIIEQLGGQLWAESEEGEGSRFFVRLRLADEVSARDRATAVRRARQGPGRVVILERDADLLELFGAEFGRAGWSVHLSRDGTEGLELVKTTQPDVVAVGLELADMHGLEFLQRLRGSPEAATTPALLVGPGGDPAQAVAYGADGWLVGDADALVEEAARLAAGPRKPVVLIVEDDPAVRSSLIRGLRRSGYACLEAATSEAGLELAREATPDIVVTDWQIPGTPGAELVQAIRRVDGLDGVPAILITGRALGDLKEQIAELNVDLLTKPFSVATLARRIDDLIGEGNETT